MRTKRVNLIMQTTQKPAFILLFLLISFGSVSAVFFTPALPQITTFFGIDNATAQYTITLFLIGYAFGQLLYGPLANGYGRKMALYIGITLEIVASLACALSAQLHAFWLLVTARLLMALGASVGLKMTFTLISDCYSQADSIKIISHLMMAFAITPGLGVAIGGFLTQHFNWQSCFYFMAGYGAVLLYLTARMTETATITDRSALNIGTIIHKYSLTLKNKQLILGASLLGCSTAFVYLFAALAPFIAIQHLQLNPSQYGLWNLLPPVGIILGSQLSAYLAAKIPATKALFSGTGIIILGIMLMALAFACHFLFALTLFLPQAIIYVGLSFIFANASTLAMDNVQDKASASAMMNFINMGIATISVLFVGLTSAHSIFLLPIIYGIVIFIMLGLVFCWHFCAFLARFR